MLGLDMSRAFDTINRSKLLNILGMIQGVGGDELRLIRILLSNTSLRVRFNGIITEPFSSNVGSPQGDALSPILFAIYLEYAIRLLKESIVRPDVDVNARIPDECIYADDIDFISLDKSFLDDILTKVGPIFGQLKLLVNTDKTDRTSILFDDNDENNNQSWRDTKKLGSLLGVEEDVSRRKVLALQCFKKLHNLWNRSHNVKTHIRLMAYKTIVESVLLFNGCTWALSTVQEDKLDTFQRRMLRQILHYKWSDKITNEELYREAGVFPASLQVLQSRWRMFGHTLRLNENTPARKAMTYYFNDMKNGRQGPRVLISTCLSKEYHDTFKLKIDNKEIFDKLTLVAQDRDAWKSIVDAVVETRITDCSKKRYVQRQKRKGNFDSVESTHQYSLRSKRLKQNDIKMEVSRG